VTCMDEAIGEVMGELKKLGIEKNTLIIFLSDNGGSGNGGNAPLEGGKSTLWEGGLRVPFIARWPEKLHGGKMAYDFLTSLEILPSILAATGVKPPAGVQLDGFDMLPVLRGDTKSPREEMFWQHRGSKAVRSGHWKWLESEKGALHSGLFDLRNDLGEKADLSRERPDIVEMMKSRFGAWRKEMDASEPHGPFQKP
jgi:arylsulfatase A-like enzyme